MMEKYRSALSDRKFMGAVLASIALFLVSLVINFYAGIYATQSASNPVTDIVLSNIRVYDVDLIFIYGPLLLWIFVTVLCLKEPARIPFTISSIALFVIIRSAFISLTHLGPFPTQAVVDYSSNFIKRFTFGGDLFFSAHTGLPFLMALSFRPVSRSLFFAFFAAAIFFGIVVLLGHLHYSIDVLSAFFITYAIFHMAEFMFKKDRQMFLGAKQN